MNSEDLYNLTTVELCDLLVKNTTELLDILNQRRPDKKLLLDKKGDVELIQSAIKGKNLSSA